MNVKMDKESKFTQVVFHGQPDTLKGQLREISMRNGKITKYVVQTGPLKTIALSKAQIAQIKIRFAYKRWVFPVTVEYPDGEKGTRWPTYIAGNELLLGVISDQVTEETDDEIAVSFELQTYCWSYKGESVALDEDFLAKNLSRWESELGMSLGLVPTDAFNREKMVKLTQAIEPQLGKWSGW